jgi:hypothetical protein
MKKSKEQASEPSAFNLGSPDPRIGKHLFKTVPSMTYETLSYITGM